MCVEVPPSPTLALAALGEGHHVETSHRQGVGRNTRRSAGIGLSTWTPPTKATPAGTGWASTIARTPDPFEAPIPRSYHGPGQPMQGLRPPRVGSTVQAPVVSSRCTSAIRSSRQGRHARVNIGGVPTQLPPISAWRDGRLHGRPDDHICSDNGTVQQQSASAASPITSSAVTTARSQDCLRTGRPAPVAVSLVQQALDHVRPNELAPSVTRAHSPYRATPSVGLSGSISTSWCSMATLTA